MLKVMLSVGIYLLIGVMLWFPMWWKRIDPWRSGDSFFMCVFLWPLAWALYLFAILAEWLDEVSYRRNR